MRSALRITDSCNDWIPAQDEMILGGPAAQHLLNQLCSIAGRGAFQGRRLRQHAEPVMRRRVWSRTCALRR